MLVIAMDGYSIINIFIDLSFVFAFSFSMLFLLRKVARHPCIGLVDNPSSRKHHQGAIPLVGGISTFLSIAYFLYNNTGLFPHSYSYLFCITVLVVIGVFDDKFDISFKFRMLVQLILAFYFINISETQLANLGDLLGFGDILLAGSLGQIITVLGVLGAITAFNMIDGFDGLLGGLASVTFIGLAILFSAAGLANYSYICIVFIVAMLPYLLFNLGFMGKQRKVFMGDAGSMLIGFTIIFLLLSAVQSFNEVKTIRTVTALWLIALPLIDMTAIILRRVYKGVSPFRADREHLHHIFERLGFSGKQTLTIICGAALCCAVIGILGEIFKVAEYIMFYLFIALFIIYTALLSNIWKVTKKIRSISRFRRIKKRSQ